MTGSQSEEVYTLSLSLGTEIRKRYQQISDMVHSLGSDVESCSLGHNCPVDRDTVSQISNISLNIQFDRKRMKIRGLGEILL